MHHGDPLDELSRLSILLGGVGDHPGEREKRPSTLHFRYEHPRTAPFGSGGALGYGDALWKKHRAGRARVHRGTHGFVCWESMNLIDHGRNLRASLPSVRAIGDPLHPFCHFY